MRIYPTFFNIFFKGMDPEKAHHVGFWGVQTLRNVGITRALRKYFQPAPELATTVMGITFPSPFGLAAGFDKGGKGIAALAGIGFGHVEIGTITGQAQPGNPQPRLFRLVEDKAVINRMGFNNDGAAAAGPRVAAARADLETEYRGAVRPVIGVNIGKTKVTPLEEAVEDYRYSAAAVARWVDYLVVNVSSPNTPGLRSLQSVETLRPILEAVREAADRAARRHVPLLVKIAPDLADEDIDAVAQMVLDMGLDGVVATNTTIDHDLGEGGLSGAPLLPRALEVVRRLRRGLGQEPTIIGVGGISSVMDAELMLDAGADLLQAYTAFIYNGPAWPGRINRALATGSAARATA